MSLRTSTIPFKDLINRQVHDEVMQKAVANAQETIGRNRQKMIDDLGHWEDWRDRATQIRDHVLANLDAYLYQLSEKVEEHGGHVFFAETKEEATQYILSVAREKKAKKIVKAKSMVTEEIGMNDALENAGINVIETDLAEFILQQAKDAPSHVVVPAIHKNREQIRQIFHDKLGYNGSDTPEEMTRFVRQKIRDDFFTADIGVTGCNFAVAETGSVCLVTNEGNARLSTTLPKTHIAVMGMERIAPTFKEVDILITMLARSAVGLRLTGYNTWLTGPREKDHVDGPEDFHLVIVDNGRSKIIGTEFKDILRCIRCGACMNTCPAYRHIGGQGYGSIYPGPVGAVLTPLLGGYKDFKNLPYVCSLCTACDSVCPVKIPLSSLIKKHRDVMVREKITPITERTITDIFNYVNRHPTLWKVGMNWGAHAARWFIKEGKAPLNIGALKEWTEARNLPKGDGESFRNWFKKHQKEEK
ncbi:MULTISPECIES: LutB/LldF family L-lactate oxidation iron-sulfur protein [Proteus]|jgi:L-lactate dehydrogenase complex protein LldF|uniref:LutB/LldF family L-lactate oxidation iron-sulfur protein n=1 Tax=Proteus TaxID=583 RepID=UPI0005048D64|nr:MULTISPECIES: LutB/LldF family L-lactate oxidation iron-sulfur protein [Proteus]KGA58025.1 iron-sulfur cluster-binding protein [Proteus vulgaris]MCH4254992.1 LutB/LldF family L-lactate oxidation iron-sulfur protein [Proteus vulgaris]MDM3564922.1 LutB/LldF family L-lactate oxidation iron-sulfur protein [Proteus vulgaris]NBN76003.1 iron-sulfur cluster-binding protein [Proteus sp. G2615]UWU00388.1 LutB/LldF family L-lactate oxidation iron-sulfur protein [Proteus vulgaris]